MATPVRPEVQEAVAAAIINPGDPAVVRARIMARLQSIIARLQEDAYCDAIVAESYAAMVSRTNGSGAVKRAGARVLRTFFAIGPPPAGHDAANGQYDSVEALLIEPSDDTFRQRVRAYADVCMTSEALAKAHTGTTAAQDWENLLDNDGGTIDSLEDCEYFDKLRERVTLKFSSSQGPVTGAGSGGGGGGGGSGSVPGTLTAHRPELPKLSNTEEMTNVRVYRHFKTMLAASASDQTHTALRVALQASAEYSDSWRLYLEENSVLPGWDPEQQSLHVREFLTAQMKELNPETFAAQDLEDAVNFKQTTSMPTTDYLRKKHAYMQSAKLSGDANGGADPLVANEKAWCAMALAGMLRQLQTKMKEHIASVELVSQGAIVGYDGHGHITEWAVFTRAAIRIGMASRLDPKTGAAKEDGDGDKPGKKSEKDLTTSQKASLRNQRKVFAAQALAAGGEYITACGNVMMARDFVYDEANSKVLCHPCFSVSEAVKRKLPPMLVDMQGKKAPNNQQPCRFAWNSQACPRGAQCYFMHVSKEDFLTMVKEKTTDLRLAPQSPGAMAGASSAAASAAGSGVSEERMVALLTTVGDRVEQQVSALSAKVEVVMKDSERIDKIGAQVQTLEDCVFKMLEKAESAKSPPAAKAEADRRAEQRKRLVHMATRDKDDASGAEESKSGSFASSFAVFVPGSEEYWELEEVRDDASILVAKATSMYEESHRPSGKGKRGSAQPVIELALGACKVKAMVDTGCAPTALMPVDKLNEIEQKIGDKCMGPLVLFKVAKVISGVADSPDAVRVIGSRQIQFAHPDSGRPLTVSVGLMQGGNCGDAELMIGNYHMSEDWKAVLDMGSGKFVVNTPEDGGKPLGFQIMHLGASSKSKAKAMAVRARPH